MPVEIEAKMKVEDLSIIRNRLTSAGAVMIGDFLEHNLYFDTDDRSLLAADRSLRLRRATNINSGDSANLITLKGPRQHGQLKSREETEVTVGDFDAAMALLEQMGYARVLLFEKRRQSWSLGGCQVELDQLPHLGAYVEIEGPKEELVLRLRDSLQLSDRPLVRASYIAMLMTYLQERGETAHEVTFPSQK